MFRISNYLIVLVLFVSLTLRLYFKNNVNNLYNIQLPLNDLNNNLNSFLELNHILEDGKLDIITLFHLLSFFILGYKYGITRYNLLGVILLIISMEKKSALLNLTLKMLKY